MSLSYIEKQMIEQGFSLQEFNRTLNEFGESSMLMVKKTEDRLLLF